MDRLPHPDLLPFLEKQDITLHQFWMNGRKAGVYLAQRSAIITELHQSGKTWVEMCAITGLSHGTIQRLTKAMWNDASRENARENGRRTGYAWKGKKRPGQLERQWVAGTYEFHTGRKRSPEERQRQKDAYTPEVRAKMSAAKVRFLKAHPNQLRSRGKRSWEDVSKERFRARICVRSSYEKKAVEILETTSEVVFYEYEPVLVLPSGRSILPDFLVAMDDGAMRLIEVKPRYVLDTFPQDSRDMVRIAQAREESRKRGWHFEIWTEKELGL